MDGDRHWATTLIRGSQPKQTRCRDPSSTNTASKPKKSDIFLCLLSNSAGGPSGTHWPGQCLMKCSSQDAKVFAACELPFYKGALCAFSLLLWQLQDGDGWWSSKYCHFLISRDLCWRAFGTEHACESLRHGSLQAGLFLLAVHIVLPFLVYLQRSRRLKAEAWRRRGNAACMMFSSYILLLGLLWLATSWFISIYFWWLCMLSFLSLFVFGKEQRISSKKMTKARKDFIHKSRQRKNATEDESNLPHMLASRWKQPATHACKQVFTNTRQQATKSDNKQTKNQVKNNRWIL